MKLGQASEEDNRCGAVFGVQDISLDDLEHKMAASSASGASHPYAANLRNLLGPDAFCDFLIEKVSTTRLSQGDPRFTKTCAMKKVKVRLL